MPILPVLLLFCCLLSSPFKALATPDLSHEALIPSSVAPSVARPVTLVEVVAQALAHSPRLLAAHKGTLAARGELDQAGAWPNPEIGTGVENFAGSSSYRSFDSAEINYGVSQQIPLTGKISAREAIASAALAAATIEEEAVRQDIIRDTTIAFMTAAAAEAQVEIAREQKDLAADILQTVSRRVSAAAAPLIQKSRSEVENASAVLALDKAHRERDTARQALAAVVGIERFEAPIARDAFYAISKPDALPAVRQIDHSIDSQRESYALAQARAQIELEQANALPDPRFSLGVREFQSTGDRAVLFSVGLPIPVLDSNSGNIEKARQGALRTEFDHKQARLDRTTGLARAHARLMRSYVEATTLKSSILPSANQAFRLSRDGYAAGRFPYLEVLDAQRSLFVARQQEIETLRDFHIAQAEVARLLSEAKHAPLQVGEYDAE